MANQRRRQEIYDRIRSSSKEAVILEEMQRLGFWPRESEKPSVAEQDIKRRGELNKRLGDLSKRSNELGNTEKMLKEARNKRLKESREQRQATKERRIQEKIDKAQAWAEKQNTSICYLGKGVSQDLNKYEEQTDKLTSNGLDSIADMQKLAALMQITVNELRFLAYTRAASTSTHYQRFDIPKKTGGVRHISAPMPRLKRCQEWILHNVLEKIELHQAAHGFRLGRSIITNAKPHLQQDVLINLDLKDFFPSIDYPRIKGLFKSFGYSAAISSVFALLCSEHKIIETELDGETYYMATDKRVLPQGAPSSPAITNIICRALDARLHSAAKSLGFTYTRYADDLSFSGSDEAKQHAGQMLRRCAYIVAQEGFTVHPDKTRVLRKGQRQEVTGLIVNDELSISRKTLKNFKTVLFQIEKDGPAGKKWGQSSHVLSAIRGYANFVSMVHPEKGAAFTTRVNAIWDKYQRDTISYPSRSQWDGPIAQAKTQINAALETPTVAGPDAQSKQEASTQQAPNPARPANAGRERTGKRPQKKPWWKFW